MRQTFVRSRALWKALQVFRREFAVKHVLHRRQFPTPPVYSDHRTFTEKIIAFVDLELTKAG